MVSNLNLCGGQCLKGVTCSTVPFYEINIYVCAGQSWRNALSTEVDNVFLSLDSSGETFKAMVLGIPGDSKDCPKRLRTFWKRPCDVIVRWNGTKSSRSRAQGMNINAATLANKCLAGTRRVTPGSPLPRSDMIRGWAAIWVAKDCGVPPSRA